MDEAKRKFAVNIRATSDLVYHVWAETSEEASKMAINHALAYNCPSRIVNGMVERCAAVEINPEHENTPQTYKDRHHDDYEYEW